MKISYLVILLLALFASCKKETEGGPVKVSGVIQNQSFTTYQYGTHILIDINVELLYALRSNKIDLDKYVDKNVKIRGFRIKGYPVAGGPIYLEVADVDED